MENICEQIPLNQQNRPIHSEQPEHVSLKTIHNF